MTAEEVKEFLNIRIRQAGQDDAPCFKLAYEDTLRFIEGSEIWEEFTKPHHFDNAQERP